MEEFKFPMLLQSRLFSRLALLALTLPLAGFSAAVTSISVNSTCDYNCAASLSAGALTVGTSSGSTFSFGVTLANGDMYTISGSYANSFPGGTFLGFYPIATYTGNSIHGAVDAVGQDTLSIDMFQDFFSATATKWDGSYNEIIPIDLPVAGSSATGNVSYDGQTVGVLGPVYGTGFYTLTGNAPLSGLTGTLLTTDYNLTFVFPGGTATAPGSFASSPAIPEPVQTIPVAVGLIGLLALKARKARS
jgi:hypothetical protein